MLPTTSTLPSGYNINIPQLTPKQHAVIRKAISYANITASAYLAKSLLMTPSYSNAISFVSFVLANTAIQKFALDNPNKFTSNDMDELKNLASKKEI